MANTEHADVSKALASDRDNTAMDNVLPSVRGSSDHAPSANDVALMTTSCFNAPRKRLAIGRAPPIHPACRRCRPSSTS